MRDGGSASSMALRELKYARLQASLAPNISVLTHQASLFTSKAVAQK
jgi:hypothetical protein